MFKARIRKAPSDAATLVNRALANAPMMSLRRVNISSAITGAGRAKLRTTWLMTSASVELTPSQTTMKAGNHRDQAANDDRDAEADKTLHDHLPGHCADRRAGQPGRQQRGEEHARRGRAEQRRQRRIGGLDFGDIGYGPAWNALAAITTIAMLTRPAIDRAT